MVKLILKNNLSYLIFTLGLIGKRVIGVNGQYSDCAIYDEAVKELGPGMEKNDKICCFN